MTWGDSPWGRLVPIIEQTLRPCVVPDRPEDGVEPRLNLGLHLLIRRVPSPRGASPVAERLP
jgi:hypothetical protein